MTFSVVVISLFSDEGGSTTCETRMKLLAGVVWDKVSVGESSSRITTWDQTRHSPRGTLFVKSTRRCRPAEYNNTASLVLFPAIPGMF